MKTVVQRCSVKKVSLEISQTSQENTLAQLFSCEFFKIFKNTFFNRTPLDDCFCFLTSSNPVNLSHFSELAICNPFIPEVWKIEFYAFFYTSFSRTRIYICDALRDSVPFVQFKKREKNPWRSVTFSKVAGWKPATLVKVTLLYGCLSRFFKLYKWYQIAQNITYVF